MEVGTGSVVAIGRDMCNRLACGGFVGRAKASATLASAIAHVLRRPQTGSRASKRLTEQMVVSANCGGCGSLRLNGIGETRMRGAVASLATDYLQPWERSVPQHKGIVHFRDSPPDEASQLGLHQYY